MEEESQGKLNTYGNTSIVFERLSLLYRGRIVELVVN